MQFTHLAPVDLAIVAIYFAAVLLVGFLLKRETNTSESFFLANRSITSWVAGLSFVAANMGALELMGWAASTYEYGIITVQWYWIGSVPAILFLAIVMMPFYYRSRATSVPGYLRQRFGEPSRALSAGSFAAMTLLMSGINMFAMAKVMNVVLGWDMDVSIWVSSVTVAAYVFLGGLLSAIFNEVLQFVLIWLGALLIAIVGLIEAGGWSGVVARIHHNFPGQDYTHMWRTLGSFSDNPMGINWVGVVFGLGAVISMGYWTTDFLVVQRVISAKDLRSAKLAPIIGAGFKMMVPLIVILPGLLGLAVLPFKLVPENMLTPGAHSYNDVLPLMLARYCGPGLLGLGVTALIAGFMSGMAGNVSAFATVWTYDIYRAIRVMSRRDATDAHYVAMGRWCTVVGVAVSVGTSYLVRQSPSIMDYVQELFSFFIAPLFGTVLLGMMWKRATPAGGFWGLAAGTGTAIALWAWVRADPSAIQYVALSPHAKDMAVNMFRALWAWVACVSVTVLVSLVTKPKPAEQLVGLVYGYTKIPSEGDMPLYQRPIFWAGVVAVVFVILNIIFW